MDASLQVEFKLLMEEVKKDKGPFFEFVQRMKTLGALPPSDSFDAWTPKQQSATSFVLFPEEVFFEDHENITVYIDILTSGKAALPQEHAHAFFELVYVYSGSCFMSMGKKEYELAPESISVFNTQATHRVFVKQGEAVLINILVRKPTFSNTMLNMVLDNDLFFNFFLHSIYEMKEEPSHLQFRPLNKNTLHYFVYQIVLEYHRKSIYIQSMMRHLSAASLLSSPGSTGRKSPPSLPRMTSTKTLISPVLSFISATTAMRLRSRKQRTTFITAQITCPDSSKRGWGKRSQSF